MKTTFCEKRNLFFIEIVVTLFCLALSTELFDSWHTSPLDRGSWIAFLLWSLPIIAFMLLPQSFISKTKLSFFYLLCAIITTTIGFLGSLNVLHYLGLAFALGALLPPHWLKIIWTGTSISWMPGFGWFGSHYFPEYIFAGRLTIALIAGIGMFLAIRKKGE